MDNSNLADRATISFPISLPLREAEGLIKYLAENLPANITCIEEQFVSFYSHDSEEPLERQEGTASISGTIMTQALSVSSCFESIPDRTKTERIQALRFILVPGWDERDYDPEMLGVWDNTRTVVANYFRDHAK